VNALLPFAPARARLHAERATSVLRAADPNAEEPLPSRKLFFIPYAAQGYLRDGT
jgi:hypothetical protein